MRCCRGKVPNILSFKHLHRQAVPGSRVFIHGASGAVGLAAVQLAMPRLHGHVLRLHHLGVQKSPKVKVFAVVSHRAETIQQHV